MSFFLRKSCRPVTQIYRKKNLHDVPIFLLHTFTAKKIYTTYGKKKLQNVTILLLHAFAGKKKYKTYRKTNYTM